MQLKRILFCIFFIIACRFTYAHDGHMVMNNNTVIKIKSLRLVDLSRNRSIPVETYVVEYAKSNAKLPVVIISHGYAAKNTEYSFLARSLALQGYFIASIQHELPSDPKLPRTGNLFKKRMPFWECGAQNILFVIAELKRAMPGLALDKVVLLGHSNGGDISMFFAAQHPEIVAKVISLDSLRYPFPIEHHIPMLSIRSNDMHADPGVLPTTGATIITLKDAKHIDMYDPGPEKVKQEIMDLVIGFLKG